MRKYVTRNDRNPGYCYLIEAKDSDGLYKIGLTRNPARRIEQLNRSQSPYHLAYLKLIEVENMASVESHLHQQFKAHGSGKNEWFRFAPSEVNRVIAEMDRIENSASESSGRWQFNLPFEFPAIASQSRFEFVAMSLAGCLIGWAVLSPLVKPAPVITGQVATVSKPIGKCVVAAPLVNVRLGVGTNNPIASRPLPAGTVIENLGESGGWVHSKQGWIAGNHLRCGNEVSGF